jgi:F0F1-type ATP synthase delta subunit
MKISPKDIARSLIDTVASSTTVDVDDACMSAINMLKQRCPGVTLKTFARVVEKELKRRGETASGLLVVPNEHSLKAETIEPHLKNKMGKHVHIDRKTEPELIGGAVLLVEHRRIDCSVQGALHALLQTFLLPID